MHAACTLPADDALRHVVHNEVHTRPPARIAMPALVVYVAVLHQGVTRQQQLDHLRRLPGQEALALHDLESGFVRLRVHSASGQSISLQWERHTEFTRYAFAVPLEESTQWQTQPTACANALGEQWLGAIPGQTFAAIALAMLHESLTGENAARLDRARQWLGSETIFGAQLGNGHSWGLSALRINAEGFEPVLVLAPRQTSASRAGRIAQRLLDLETYRLMALRSLPTVKQLAAFLSQSEAALVDITTQMQQAQTPEHILMDRLTALAAAVERSTAEHAWRFAATRAYGALVAARMDELREKPIDGIQTLRDFIQRRMSPAMATVAASEQRLGTLAERISRASALLRTRLELCAEQQNRELLEKLTRGQAMQLSLQSTVEGLSIAAISYYMVSLVLYAAKAAKSAGWLPWQPETLAGCAIPVVVGAVWWITRRIHRRLHKALGVE